MKHTYRTDTILLHGGHVPDATGARVVPIYQTTSYVFKNSAHAARLFGLKEEGNIYTRIMNPTTEVLEKRISMMENAAGALAVASGQAAISMAVMALARSGDEIVSAGNLYGGTYNLFKNTLPRFGITVRFADTTDPADFEKLITPKTRALYAESMGNPGLEIADIEGLAGTAHAHGIPLVIDNTVLPYIFHPIEHGADILVYSATKFIGGHGNSIAGLIVDSGNIRTTPERIPSLFEEDPAYHGINFAGEFGPLAYIMKVRLDLLRDMGAALSPFNSFLVLQGMETLHLRMARHSENAMKVARFLSEDRRIAWVNYPGLPSDSQHRKGLRYLRNGFGALVGFGIRGGIEAAVGFIDRLKLVSHLANIGDVRTLVIHPASTTHHQLSPLERSREGITDDFIRLCVGIEDADDIISDIDQALNG